MTQTPNSQCGGSVPLLELTELTPSRCRYPPVCHTRLLCKWKLSIDTQAEFSLVYKHDIFTADLGYFKFTPYEKRLNFGVSLKWQLQELRLLPPLTTRLRDDEFLFSPLRL